MVNSKFLYLLTKYTSHHLCETVALCHNIIYILVGKSIICIGIIPNLFGVLRIFRAIRVRIIEVNVVPYIGQCMRVRFLLHTHKTHAVVSGGAICYV